MKKDEIMKFGEMQIWTERFNQIIGGAQTFKKNRLYLLRDDLIQAYEGKRFDPFAGLLFAAITEEMR
jgi:hypothetical protein